jgi:hypothetical protein
LIDDLRAWNDLLTQAPSVFEADFNRDSQVDVADLTHWTTGFGTPAGATNLHGDADNDQDVDGADFLIWQQQHGLPDALFRAVAEPQSVILALLTTAASALTARRWSRIRYPQNSMSCMR